MKLSSKTKLSPNNKVQYFREAMFPNKIVFFLILIFLSTAYNNFNELKKDMENRVQRIALAMEQIMSQKCMINTFECPVKSFNLCEGTGPRQCLVHFPPSSTCNGLNKYSTVSGIRVPNSYASFNLSEQTKFFICKTAEPQLQSVFQQLINSNQQTYAWLNFGFVDGTHRVSPGFKFKKQRNLESCENYDPRGRPWYATNAFNRKKMIILVENSKRIHELPNRFHSIQLSLAALLKTSQQGDYFNVIQFSDSPRLLINQNDMKLVSLVQQATKYDNKTHSDGGYYNSLANNISKSMSTITNYTRALNMAVEVLKNSRNQNSDYENFILMFSGFQPTTFSVSQNGQSQYELFLKAKEKQLNMSFIFFGFGVDMVNKRGKELLKNMSCKFDGIFFEISDIKYESMFLDQARGYYEYLSQGNQIQGYRWTNFYDDQFYLGRMTTVVRAAYYKEKNVTRLIGLASLDVLVSQMIIYKNQQEIKKQLQVTQRPFKRNISLCALQTIRRKQRCMTVEESQCDYYEYCEPKLIPSNDTIMAPPVDSSDSNCCPFEAESMAGMIVGFTLGGLAGLILVIFLLYCFVCKKRNESKLEQTYSEIFSKFKDFDQTRVRTDSEISLIKE